MTNRKDKKPFFILHLDITDILILCVFALGVCSTFNSNRENMGLALIFLMLATLLYFFASSAARRKENTDGFTRSLNSFVSGLVFLVAPCIFFYHWQYKNNFESGVLLLFVLAGIMRISAFNNFSRNKEEAEKYYYTGIPVFWAPILVLIFYCLSFVLNAAMINWVITITLIVYSVGMLVNKEFKFLHKPKSWGKTREK